jgi:hypothetical protein
MTLVATVITPTLWQQNLTGPSDNARENTAVPRAVMVYGSAFDWPGPGSGNDRQLSINIALPKDYAYFLTDATLSISQEATSGYMYAQSVAYLDQISDTGPGASSVLRYQMVSYPAQAGPGLTSTSTQGDTRIRDNQPITLSDSTDDLHQIKVYNLVDKPKSLMYPYQDTRFGSEVRIRLWDNVDAGGDYTGSLGVTLLQYDINQAYSAGVHNAVLTR